MDIYGLNASEHVNTILNKSLGIEEAAESYYVR